MLKAVKKLRVEWSHCDPLGIIFNPHYFVWMDQATHNLFDAAGFAFKDTVGKDGFIGCPLVSSGADYLKPVRYGDILELNTEVVSFGKTSLRVEHEFTHDRIPIAKGFEIRVWGIGDQARPQGLRATAVPEAVKDLLSRDIVLCTNLT